MIPKKIHQIWLGSPLPEWLRPFCESWRRYHPSWEYRLWTEKDIPRLINQALFDKAESLMPQNVGQFRSDILRYEILLTQGGLYVDTDMECLRSIEQLSNVQCFLARESPKWVNNAVIGAIANHPFISTLVYELVRSVKQNPGRRPNVVSGPQYLTPIIQRYRSQVVIYPKEFFYPYLYSELHRGRSKFKDSYAVHHWANRRRERGIPL